MFIIIRRHYELILRQTVMNYPEESGGLLGGRHGVILGVYPVFNWAEKNVKFREFGLSKEDLQKAREFFTLHDLDYVGTYHSHPKGVPYPSAQDLSHKQEKHLMIVGLQDPHNPVVAIYENKGGHAVPERLKLIEDQDIAYYAPAGSSWRSSEQQRHMERMSHLIQGMINGFSAYKKQDAKRFGSSFSVEA